MQQQIIQRRLNVLQSHIGTNALSTDCISLEDVAAKSAVKFDFDIIIIGAGVVGCAAACAFGKQGRKVLVCERDLSEPDRIVGELLQPGGVAALEEIGIAHVLDNMDAVIEKGYCVFYKNQPVHLPYPDGRTGASFHHGRLIMNLRKAARETPNVEMREVMVADLLEEDGVIRGVVTQDKQTFRAPLTFVVDGCFSKFRSLVGGPVPTSFSSFVGLVLHMSVHDMPFPAHGHVILANPSPILFYALTPTEVRVLVDVPHPVPRAAALPKYLTEKIVPQMPEAFRAPFLAALQSQKLRSMPNNQMSGRQATKPGVMLLGDSFNMRHPLTGGGMTVGFSDCVVLSRELKGVDLRNWKKVAAAQNRFISKRKPLAATINILAMALYKVFSAQGDPLLPIMQESCFAYFRLGGIAASGPTRLLAGMTPNYYILLAHFFAVALYGSLRYVGPLPRPWRIANSIRLIRSAAQIVFPLMHGEKVTALNWVYTPPQPVAAARGGKAEH